MRFVPETLVTRLAVIAAVAALVGCGSRTAARAPGSGSGAGVGADAGGVGAAALAAAADAAAPVDPAIAKCLESGQMRAVITVASSTPDCSGVGHDQLVFDVVHLPGSGPAIDKAYLSCPLYGGCSPLGDARAKDGSVWVAVLTPDAKPARTVYCVALPATQAAIACAVPVDSVEAGQRLISP